MRENKLVAINVFDVPGIDKPKKPKL